MRPGINGNRWEVAESFFSASLGQRSTFHFIICKGEYGTTVYIQHHYVEWLFWSLRYFQAKVGEAFKLYEFCYVCVWGDWYYSSVSKSYQDLFNLRICLLSLVSMVLLHLVELRFDYQVDCQTEDVTRWNVDRTDVLQINFFSKSDPGRGLELAVSILDTGMGFFTPTSRARQSKNTYFLNEGS